MSRFAKLASLLLIALWLPATLHCQFEALGFGVLFSCPEQSTPAEHANEPGCHNDSCQVIESGQFTVSTSKIIPALLPAPVCVFVQCLLHVAPLTPATETFACCQTEPLPLQRTWQFTRRAALPARAPDVLTT